MQCNAMQCHVTPVTDLVNPSSLIYIVKMALLAARGPDQPNTSQTERDRIRELSKCV